MLYICREFSPIYKEFQKNMMDRCENVTLQYFRNARDCNCDPNELTYGFGFSEEFYANYFQSSCYLAGKNVIFLIGLQQN